MPATPSIIEASLNKILGEAPPSTSATTAGTGGQEVVDLGQRAPISYISGLSDFMATPGTTGITSQAAPVAAPANPLAAAPSMPTPAPAPAPAPAAPAAPVAPAAPKPAAPVAPAAPAAPKSPFIEGPMKPDMNYYNSQDAKGKQVYVNYLNSMNSGKSFSQ